MHLDTSLVKYLGSSRVSGLSTSGLPWVLWDRCWGCVPVSLFLGTRCMLCFCLAPTKEVSWAGQDVIHWLDKELDAVRFSLNRLSPWAFPVHGLLPSGPCALLPQSHYFFYIVVASSWNATQSWLTDCPLSPSPHLDAGLGNLLDHWISYTGAPPSFSWPPHRGLMDRREQSCIGFWAIPTTFWVSCWPSPQTFPWWRVGDHIPAMATIFWGGSHAGISRLCISLVGLICCNKLIEEVLLISNSNPPTCGADSTFFF